MKKNLFLLAIVFVFCSKLAFAEVSADNLYQQCIKAEAFFTKSQGIADADVASCVSQVHGFKDGIAVSQVIYNKDRKSTVPSVCLPNNVNTIQLVSVLNKWFRENPENRHYPAYVEMWAAFRYYYPC